jgi:stage V sporulation protein R
MDLPTPLRTIKKELEQYALECGLDFYETIFDLVSAKEINGIASFGGFPVRYPHWRFGMEFEQLNKGHVYGLHKIYELVINNDPCYAYLLDGNSTVEHKLVMAHVFGHGDFFKNNLWFSHTNPKMIDEAANHATRIRRYVERYGPENVDSFIDVCFSIDNLIDPYSPFFIRAKRIDDRKAAAPGIKKLKSKDYMDRFINPPEFLEAQKYKAAKQYQQQQSFPLEPTIDVLQFLVENAPLEEWQQDILGIIREESYYFAPQRQTKIMNEGWATYWHSRIMTEYALQDSELIEYADHHAGTVSTASGTLNPYKLGVELFRDIEDRWNKGRFGKAFDECEDMEEKKQWDKKLGLGREKIFQVRRLYNDVTFIDEFFTREFCVEHRLFTYDFNKSKQAYEISTREFQQVKERLLFMLTNMGSPFIFVADANHSNRGELYLVHRHEGVDLKIDEAEATLKNIQLLWNRPVHLETKREGKGLLLTFDGDGATEQPLTASSDSEA